jgi:hypothetical protein
MGHRKDAEYIKGISASRPYDLQFTVLLRRNLLDLQLRQVYPEQPEPGSSFQTNTYILRLTKYQITHNFLPVFPYNK